MRLLSQQLLLRTLSALLTDISDDYDVHFHLATSSDRQGRMSGLKHYATALFPPPLVLQRYA